jgi:hypothetical protein
MSGRFLTIHIEILVDHTAGLADFLLSLRFVSIDLSYDAHLLSPPLSNRGDWLGFDCHISPHIFALEGYNLPQICDACGYNVNPDKTFDVMSSRLSWLCCSWFNDKLGFLKMLYDSGALISGLAALKLVSGKDFVPSDIDIVVSSLGEDAIDNFLQLKGYTRDDSFALGDADDYLSNFASGGLHVCQYRSSG